MSKSTPIEVLKKRKGCLLMVLAIAFVASSGIYFLTAGIRDAKQIEQTLIDRFDWAGNYTPIIDGSIDPQRIEAFIRVREAVQSDCADNQAVLLSIKKLDDLEDDKETSPGNAASTGLEGLKSAFSAGPKMVKFSTTRNTALLKEEMGIGEYLYIYLTAYGEQLAIETASDYAKMEEAYVSERALKEYTQILTNQLNALQADEQPSSNPALVTDLRVEIEALTIGSHTSPWPNGPLGKTQASLAPYHQHLTNLYCSGIVKIELLQKNRGFQLEG
jgi:hypothetical protein